MVIYIYLSSFLSDLPDLPSNLLLPQSPLRIYSLTSLRSSIPLLLSPSQVPIPSLHSNHPATPSPQSQIRYAWYSYGPCRRASPVRKWRNRHAWEHPDWCRCRCPTLAGGRRLLARAPCWNRVLVRRRGRGKRRGRGENTFSHSSVNVGIFLFKIKKCWLT